ncbi:DUF1439 domain-containing protein [Alteromonas sp. ASW11-19]|uniref:DUF1439 domain-containing protein n=1 Tax=Alteromonas salexigens TaxID=2982530 RepID=A0ABT2VL65_9ALTE|nr:DUF1439 domain-containing protein [Alteromonas salexigens]MCU7553198.1 DUF1439 domain-containing protein [Alteromonas salexigens]
MHTHLMTLLRFGCCALMTLTLIGCSNIAELSRYTVSEEDIQRQLAGSITQLQEKVSVSGIPMTLNVDSMQVDIGPEGRDVIQLGTSATASVNVFGIEYPATVRLMLEGKPVYNAEKKAVYVHNLALLDSEIEANGYRGNLAPVSDRLMMLVNSYLQRTPVYELDTSKQLIRYLSELPVELRIEQDQLVFAPVSK